VHASAEIPNCPQGDQEVNFAVDGINNRYFSCVNGVPYLRECDGNELFNQLSKKCEKFTRPQQQSAPQFQHQLDSMQNQFTGLNPNWDQYFDMMLAYQYPIMNQQYPSVVPHIPINPQLQNNRLQPVAPLPNYQPQQTPQISEFPSWMPVPNPNVPMPEFPHLAERPSQDGGSQFNYDNGKVSSLCPSIDNPSKPAHLSHETDCNKFYKCYNGRAFELACPSSQEFSEKLQRCDYHEFANCDPVELLRKKIQI